MVLLENLFYWRLPFWCSLVNWGFMSYVLHTYLPVQCPIWFTGKSSCSVSHDLHENLSVQCPTWFTWKSSCSMPHVFLHTSSCLVACLFYLKVLSDQSVNQCHLCFTCNLSDQHHSCFTCRSFCSISLVHADLSDQCHLCFTCRSSCSMSFVFSMQIFLFYVTCVLHTDLPNVFYTQIHLFKIQKWEFDSIMVKHV